MAAVPQSLADVVGVAEAKHNVQGGRALARVAKSMGLSISYTTLDQLAKGNYRRQLTPATRHILHLLSGVNETRIATLAGQPMTTPFELPPSADELNKGQRDAVISVVRAFVKANHAESTIVAPRLRVVDEEAAGRRADRRGQPPTQEP